MVSKQVIVSTLALVLMLHCATAFGSGLKDQHKREIEALKKNYEREIEVFKNRSKISRFGDAERFMTQVFRKSGKLESYENIDIVTQKIAEELNSEQRRDALQSMDPSADLLQMLKWTYNLKTDFSQKFVDLVVNRRIRINLKVAELSEEDVDYIDSEEDEFADDEVAGRIKVLGKLLEWAFLHWDGKLHMDIRDLENELSAAVPGWNDPSDQEDSELDAQFNKRNPANKCFQRSRDAERFMAQVFRKITASHNYFVFTTTAYPIEQENLDKLLLSLLRHQPIKWNGEKFCIKRNSGPVIAEYLGKAMLYENFEAKEIYKPTMVWRDWSS